MVMAKKDWYKNSYRRNLVDMHIEDWREDFLSEFDPRQYFDCLKTANIQSPMIYLHSHVGLCNWDSKSGIAHNAFKGNNKVKTLIDLCHEDGMDVIGYYSLIYNNKEYDRHPEWRMIDRNGNPSRFEKEHSFMMGSRYGLLCPNNMEYRAFLHEQFAELVGIYDCEGYFLDMTFWPVVCYCDSCKQRYAEEIGGEIPGTIDWHDPAWLQFQACREVWMGEFAEYCSDELKKMRPGITIEHQFSTMHQNWQFGAVERINDASDYAGGDLYGGHYQESFICKLYYEITMNQPFEYMTSRCDPGLGVHTTTKSLDTLRLHNLLTLAHHGAMLFIDAIDLVGTLDKHVYEDIGRVFEESMPYEKYLKGELYSEVALYFDLKSKYNADARPGTQDLSVPQLDAVLGASIALSDGNIPYTAIPGGRRHKISGKKAVAVCEAASLSEEEIADLAAYVKDGGGLYISGTTNPRLAQLLLGLEVEGLTEERATYIAPTEKGAAIFGDRYSPDIPLSYTGKQIKVKNPAGHDVLATITLPATVPDDTAKFASIHSNPPGIKTEYPALVLGNYGRGRVLWSSAAFEKNPQKSHQHIWLRGFRLLYGDTRRIDCTAPEFVQFTLFDSPEENCMYLNIINVQEFEEILPVPSFACSLDLAHDIVEVQSLPSEKLVSIDKRDGRAEFTVDGLDILRMYRLVYSR
jgi:hypothetical protein